MMFSLSHYCIFRLIHLILKIKNDYKNAPMDFIKKLEMIKRIDGMISRKSTGTPAELSQKIGVSERSLYNILSIMKRLGAPIYYSSTRLSYCYEGTVDFSYQFKVENEVEPKTEDFEKPNTIVDKSEVIARREFPIRRHDFRSTGTMNGNGI